MRSTSGCPVYECFCVTCKGTRRTDVDMYTRSLRFRGFREEMVYVRRDVHIAIIGL